MQNHGMCSRLKRKQQNKITSNFTRCVSMKCETEDAQSLQR